MSTKGLCLALVDKSSFNISYLWSLKHCFREHFELYSASSLNWHGSFDGKQKRLYSIGAYSYTSSMPSIITLGNPLRSNRQHLTIPYATTSTSIRLSSSGRKDGNESNNDVNAEVKGFFIRIPNPVQWAKDRIYLFTINKWIDPDFKLSEFVNGAKQAVSYLTRLAVMKDFEIMKQVASDEVVSKMTEMMTQWSDEQQTSVEILLSDITLASATIKSVNQESENYRVNVDVFCVALKTYRNRPLYIEMTVRSAPQSNHTHTCHIINVCDTRQFCRVYGNSSESPDWKISNILGFKVREIIKD